MKLHPTKATATHFSISEYELRLGFKEGRYPALEIGRGNRRRSLRWDWDVLQEALRQQMTEKQAV